MSDIPEGLLEQLLELIDGLRLESADYCDQPDDQQRWYNRGYANGIVKALLGLGLQHRLGQRSLDPASVQTRAVGAPWQRAYAHGESIGYRETHEITGSTTP